MHNVCEVTSYKNKCWHHLCSQFVYKWKTYHKYMDNMLYGVYNEQKCQGGDV